MNVRRYRKKQLSVAAPISRPHTWSRALRIALAFSLPSVLYILFSDRLVATLATSPKVLQIVSSTKGTLYVLLAALLIFVLAHRSLRQEATLRARAEESLRALEESNEQLDEQTLLLKESQQLFSVLFERSSVPFLLYEGQTGTLHHCNAAALQLFGVASEEDLRAVRLMDLVPQLTGQDGIMETWRANQAAAKRTLPRVFEWCRPNGERFLARITLSDATTTVQGQMLFAVCRDVTESMRAQRAVAHSEEQLRVTLNSIGDGVIAADGDGQVIMINAVAEALCGWPPRLALGRPITEVMNLRHLQNDDVAEDPASAVLKSYGIHRGRYRLQPKEGNPRQVNCVVSPILAGEGAPQGVVAVFRDITDQMQREAEILYLSYHDTLTGLYNRAFFEEEMKRLDTERQQPLSLIMGDANNLKLINDIFGHGEGDRLICQLSRVFRECCRKEDIICRWGGDEFTVLLPGTDGPEAARICQRIQEACHTQANRQSELLSPSVSLGWATKTTPEASLEQIIKDAEDMMYANKLHEGQMAFRALLASMCRRAEVWTPQSGNVLIEEMGLRICREMGLDEPTQSNYRQLVHLRDIGMAAIAPFGDRELTEQEWEQVHRHPIIGYRIARSAPELVAVAEAILCHHEHWDGTGYPRGIRSAEIPLIARIYTVAEAYFALTTGRYGHGTLPQDDAMEQLVAGSGGDYDPEVVRVFAIVSRSFQEVAG